VSHTARNTPAAFGCCVAEGRRVGGALALASLVLMCVCGDPIGCDSTCPETCRPNIRYGIMLNVVDSVTQTARACGATAWVRDGTYVDTLRVIGWCAPESLQSMRMAGAQERPGLYDLFVERPGYYTWQRLHVRVTRGECNCHVTPVLLEARLRPL
jgi:hypothetical protein